MHPLVSIIIVNFNGIEHLKPCFESLRNSSYSNYEIILVDNNSTDNSVEYTSNNYPSVIILKLDKNYGFAEANNKGTRIANGDYFLFLNNDTKVDSNFLNELISPIDGDPKIGIAQSLLLKPNGEIDSSGDFIDNMGVVYNSKSKTHQIREISSAKGASMIVKRKVFESLNGFDSKFFAVFEDVDLCWRAWIRGYRVILIPSSIVIHTGGQTTKHLQDEIMFHGIKNQIIIKITNFESQLVLKNILSFFFKYGIREARVRLDYFSKGSTSISSTDYEAKIAVTHNPKIILKSFFWLFRNFGYLLNKHNNVNSQRKVSSKTLQEHKILSDITQ